MRKLVGATNFPNETVTGLLRCVFGFNIIFLCAMNE